MVPKRKKRLGWMRPVLAFVVAITCGLYVMCLLALGLLRWVNPPITMVQIQRRVEADLDQKAYRRRQTWAPLERIAPDLQHAVISAEDGRFFQHHGIDWKEVQKVVDKDWDEGKMGRGGSTITQQFIKNLFFTTSRSFVRKAIEAALALPAEVLLPKKRILELYLNTIEWGPGVYGAEAAAQTWYGVPASRLSRDQAARLAAIIPSPLRRKPARMNDYAAQIQKRMAQSGW